MSVLKGLSWSVAGTLLKAIAGAEFPDEEWHPISTQYINSTENVAVGATMYGRDTIDLRHEGLSVGSHEREERNPLNRSYINRGQRMKIWLHQ